MILPLGGLRIGLLTASASRLGGGVAEAVIAQAAMIRSLGGEAPVFALADAQSEQDRARHAPDSLHVSRIVGPAPIGYAPDLVASLIAARLDCLHLHGIWMYPSRAGAIWARRTDKPYVISTHGMLDPWITARGRWKKAMARIGYERDSWQRARFLHALTAREADDIARESGRVDSVVIPNAGPVAATLLNGGREPHVLYIGRIHPKKNLLALVEAWKRLDPPGGARLTLAGWGDQDDVSDLRAALQGAPPSVEFIGSVYGDAKQRLLESARFTVLPSHSEGLPMAVLEGWAAGTPAILTPECNLPQGFAAGAALDCGYDAAAIAAALASALALDEPAWRARAAAALGLAGGLFSAEAVAQSWAEAYRMALSDGQG